MVEQGIIQILETLLSRVAKRLASTASPDEIIADEATTGTLGPDDGANPLDAAGAGAAGAGAGAADVEGSGTGKGAASDSSAPVGDGVECAKPSVSPPPPPQPLRRARSLSATPPGFLHPFFASSEGVLLLFRIYDLLLVDDERRSCNSAPGDSGVLVAAASLGVLTPLLRIVSDTVDPVVSSARRPAYAMPPR